MTRRTRRLAAAVGAVALMAAGLSSCNTRFGASLVRPGDPVVMNGSALPKLLTKDPVHIVAFAWDGSAWNQVPVQVDQRDLINPGQIYNRPASAWATLPNGQPYKILAYTPPPAAAGYQSFSTYTPPDSDPTLDANDEVTFLADDLGKQAPAASNPAGVTISTRQEIKTTDPLATNTSGYVYLYSSPTLSGGAKTSGVSYSFHLTSGDYKATYHMGTASNAPNNGILPNPETSTITTPTYKQNYTDRWLNDGLTINSSGSTGPDLLDRAIYPVVNAGCGRNEDTYDNKVPSSPYEGAFITNVSGPVRAIRSHIGANSFTYTFQTELFYPSREDSVIQLQGHGGLPGFASYDDFTTNLTGLTYSDNNNSGIKIDGAPDAITPIDQTTPLPANAAPVWQLVKGPAGALVTSRTFDTDLAGVKLSTYYKDQKPASPVPCTGDTAAWGQSGFQAVLASGAAFPDTDPTHLANPPKILSTRHRYFAPPSTNTTDAARYAARATRPIAVTVGS